MSDSVQNKMLQHAVVPPPAVWEKISRQLDEEFLSSDIRLSSKIDDVSVPPPASAWQNITAELHKQPEEINIRRSTPVIPLLYRRIAAAAVIIGLIVAGSFYLSPRNNNNKINRSQIVSTPSVDRQRAATPEPMTDIAPRDSNTVSVKRLSVKTLPARISRDMARRPTVTDHTMSYAVNDPSVHLSRRPVLTIEGVGDDVEVEAPPIRDSRGNIIMDMSVISKPGDPYITVTSPNGNQTRISKKFLHCLNYLNSGLSSEGSNYEENIWKTRFEEWRNRLLSEAGFVPAANNFFDIFELKELIQER